MDKVFTYFSNQEIEEFFHQLDLIISEAKGKNCRSYKIAIRNKALFSVMYYCALRVTEVCNMKTIAYNRNTNSIDCERLNNSKDNSLKILPGYEFVEKSLKKHIEVNEPGIYLFTPLARSNDSSNDLDTPLSRKTVDVIFHDVCSALNFSYANMNCFILRHSMAMNLVKRGLSIDELQYWLGHINPSSTQVYFKIAGTVNYNTAEIYRKVSRNKE